MKKGLHIVHSDLSKDEIGKGMFNNETHLQGLTPVEQEFIRKFARLTADIILKDKHEKSIRLSSNLG